MKYLAPLLVLLAGCTKDYHWTHPTADRQRIAVDRYECYAAATTTVPGVAVTVPKSEGGGFYGGMLQGMRESRARRAAQPKTVVDSKLYRLCMEARGYALKY